MLQKCSKGLHSKNPRHAAENKTHSCLLQQECQLTDQTWECPSCTVQHHYTLWEVRKCTVSRQKQQPFLLAPLDQLSQGPFMSHISIPTAGGVGISCLASANKTQLEAHEISASWCASDLFRYRCLWDEGRWALSNIWKITNTPKPFSAKTGPPDWMSPALPTLTRGPPVG